MSRDGTDGDPARCELWRRDATGPGTLWGASSWLKGRGTLRGASLGGGTQDVRAFRAKERSLISDPPPDLLNC